MLHRITKKKLGVILVLVLGVLGLTPLLGADSEYEPRYLGSHRPGIEITPEEPNFSVMSMSQPGLHANKSTQIDDFKKRMLDGTFQYEDYRQVSGLYHERSGTYFVNEGHHRLAAALEIAKEKGDWRFFKKLIERGYWSKTEAVPDRKYPLKMRTGWNNFIGCHLMLRRLVPSRGQLYNF